MWFHLAEMLSCTVAELQERMSRMEFSEWMAELSIRAEEGEEQAMADRVQEELGR